jgi:hypothetical protein
MKRISIYCCLLLCIAQIAVAQKVISKAEYFWDTDPGQGNGHAITVGTARDSVHFTASIATSGLTTGFHNLYVRSFDGTEGWSLVETQTVYITQSTTTALPNIVAAEYFWDTDPGEGKGHAITISTQKDSVHLTSTPSTSGLSAGFHNLYTRSLDSKGRWSLAEQQNVYINGSTIPVLPNIVAAEYFIDTDPGAGKGHAIVVNPQRDSVHLTQNISVSVPVGFHNLYVRSKDANNHWSLVEQQTIYVNNTATLPLININAAEYFIDTDPGEGKGTPITITKPDTTVTSQFAIHIASGMDTGYHIIYVRAHDTNNSWSVVEAVQIHVGKGALPVSILYFTVALNAGNKATLNWETTTEINTWAFEVERSTDGIHFSTIATVDAAGNAVTAQYYSATDNAVPSGTVYYSLKETDKDGTVTYSRIVHIDNNNAATIKLYPNPSKDMLHVIIPLSIHATAINIYSSSGQLVMQQKVNNNSDVLFNVSQLAHGAYHVAVILDDKIINTLNFIRGD